MHNRKSIIIAGAAKSGKSRRAVEEASKRGEYVVTSWDELKYPFGLAFLRCNPSTVIVEGLPPRRKPGSSDSELFKMLITDDEFFIDIKHQNPMVVPAPVFIFTMLTPSAPYQSLFGGMWSRLEVISL